MPMGRWDYGTGGYDPSSNYGAGKLWRKAGFDGKPWGGKPFARTGFGNNYINQNPDAYLRHYGAKIGIPDEATSLFGRWFANTVAPNLAQGHRAALIKSPFLDFRTYVNRMGPGGGPKPTNRNGQPLRPKSPRMQDWRAQRQQAQLDYWRGKFDAMTPLQRGELPVDVSQRWIT